MNPEKPVSPESTEGPVHPPAPTPKGHQRRAALLDAAEHVLGSAGGAELTMRAVADAAGVRLGHLQYYFPARSDLLTALLDRVLASSLARVAALAGAGDAAGDPAAVLDTLLGDHDDPSLVRLFTEVWAMAAHDEAAAGAVRAFYAAYAGHVSRFVRDRSPGLDPVAAHSRAEVFVMLMEGASLFRSGIAGRAAPATDAALRRTLLDLLGLPGPEGGPA
ncbi:TetR/AcrR family transcriptional regulator [Streptomyces sp. A0592]|uniref:TetR/AcrR family transcriptional regulator n=1 Tax=Streptomyces sp. A0592 TaxID=2563099 RepID=UPI00109EB21D|nr:TetR/AcrR family transcriptional regulator [Streptomyces sp. A0592]THA82215.1 TetR/AcrR family transcriptional regulator [Streptomyces sp. A0592]